MFVSREVAAARLSSDTNRLKDTTSLPVVVDKVAEKPAVITPKSELDRNVEAALDEMQDPNSPMHLPSFDALDKLVHIGTRANHQGKLDEQVAVAESAIILGQHATERLIGTSQSQVGAYERGSRNSSEAAAGIRKPGLEARLKKIRARIAMSAGVRLKRTLAGITQERVDAVESPLELARMGKDLASIMDHAAPKDTPEAPAVFHVYRPEIRQENHYKTIVVGVVSNP